MKNESGQSTVEFALIIPLLCIFLMFIIQVAVVVRSYIAVSNSSRVVARELAVNPDHMTALRQGNRIESNIQYDIARPSTKGEYLTVVAKKTVKSNLPLIGIIFPPVTVESSTTMRVEK
ncbi:MAG: TadE family protein [Acidimicrobiia bacterium]